MAVFVSRDMAIIRKWPALNENGSCWSSSTVKISKVLGEATEVGEKEWGGVDSESNVKKKHHWGEVQ